MLDDLTKPKLQAMARRRGLKPTGTKANLMRRLKSHLARRRMHQMRAREPYVSTRSQSQPPLKTEPPQPHNTTTPLTANVFQQGVSDADRLAEPRKGGEKHQREQPKPKPKPKIVKREREEESDEENHWDPSPQNETNRRQLEEIEIEYQGVKLSSKRELKQIKNTLSEILLAMEDNCVAHTDAAGCNTDGLLICLRTAEVDEQ